MSRGKELFKNTGILLIAKISTQIVNFLLIPFYTYLLSTYEYGEIDIYNSLVMIIVPFLTLQLEMALFRFFIECKNEIDKIRVVTTAVLCMISSVSVISFFYLFVTLIFSIKYPFLIYVYYLFFSIATILQQFCRATGNNIAYGVGTFLSSSLAVALNILLILVLGLRVQGVLIATILANVISSIYMLLKTKMYKYFKLGFFTKKLKKQFLEYSIPLVFNQTSSWIINFSDRLIILFFWGTSINGIYSLANKFSSVVNTFFSVYNIAWSENVIRSMHDSDSKEYLNSMFYLTYKLYLSIVIGVVNIIPLVFNFFVNKHYFSAYGHIPLLVLAMFFSGISANLGSIYIAFGKTKEVSITTILSGVCNIIINLSLINFLGLYAASVSTLISFIVLFIYRFYYIRKFFELTIDLKALLIQLFIFMWSYFAYLSSNIFLVLIGLFLNLCYCIKLFFEYRSILYKIFKNNHTR